MKPDFQGDRIQQGIMMSVARGNGIEGDWSYRPARLCLKSQSQTFGVRSHLALL
jgi:hypothetical protein